MNELPPQVQNQLAQYQQLQQQLQVVAAQRVQLETNLREIDLTLEELGKAGKKTVIYRSIGALLIEAEDRKALQAELEEHKEALGIRIEALKKQEKTLSERFQRLQEQLSKALGGSEPAAG